MSDLTAQSQQVFSPEHPYTSETITKIAQCLDGESLTSLFAITEDMIENSEKYHDLDFMALGRANHLNPGNEAWTLPLRQISPSPKLYSFTIGRIAAEISARNNNHQNKFGAWSWQPIEEAKFQNRLQDDHSTSVTCSTYHPDPTVREMASWCAAHLTQIRGVQMGLIPPTPQPSPTQTLRPYPPG